MTTGAQDIMLQIKRALNEHKEFTSRLLSLDGELVDAVQYWSKRTQQEFSLSPTEDFISKRLSHISVNPHDATNTELLKRSYVFAPDAPETSEEGAQLLNLNEDRVREVLQQLISTAKIRRDLSISTSDIDSMAVFKQDQIFYIIGERGCGKTFFLNYALSKNDPFFDEQKVIWVRVNLIPNRGFDEHLYAWIEAQIAKIVLRYYETSSKFRRKEYTKIDIIKHVRNWLSTTPRIDDLDRPRHRDNLTEMTESFCELAKDVEISPGLCDRLICQEIYSYLRTAGFSFIIILDGLDVLDIDRHHSERFAKIETEFRKLLSTYEKYGAVFVIVARRVTFRETISASPYFNFPTGHLFYIHDADFQEILKKRISAIRFIYRTKSQHWPEAYREQDWDALLQDFLNEFETILRADSLFKRFSNIEMLSRNNREKMQLVQFAFQEYLQHKTGLGYRLIEHMAKAGFDYPPIIYFYRKKEDQSFDIKATHTGSYDSRILPIITRSPCNMNDGYRVVDNFTGSPVLHGIRILQILRIISEKRRRDQRFEDLTIGELCKILFLSFGYEVARSATYVRELEAYQVLHTYDLGNIRPGSSYGRIKISVKGEFVLLRCLYDIAYLNLCAMRTPVKVDGLERRYFRIAKYDASGKSPLANWISAKCCNALSLAVVLLTENGKQLKALTSRIGVIESQMTARERLVVREGMTTGFFDFSQELSSKVFIELRRTLSPKDRLAIPLSVEAVLAINRLLSDIR